MRLLICTQAVDRNDQALGFFHSWLQAFSKTFAQIHVVCLKEGAHNLPSNILVHSLGKERYKSRLKYIWHFYRYIFSLWNDYDAVFVHMNQEYVLLGGIFWRLGGKKIVLWRNHKKGSVWTWIASRIVNTACYTSPEAYVAPYANSLRMPIGVDTKLFSPGPSPQSDSILFLGRLDAVKKPDVFLEAIQLLRSEGITTQVDVLGDPTPGRESYAAELKRRFSNIANVRFGPSVPHTETAELYRSHSIYVNITPSGSFDKTIGEALSCGAIVVSANEVLRGVIPDSLIVDSKSAESVAEGIRFALQMSQSERENLRKNSRIYVEREHSLSLLADKLAGILSK